MRFGILRLLRSQDDFGHPIRVTFKGEETHKSALGGLMSVTVQVMTFILILKSVQEIIFMDEPKIASIQRPLSESEED